MLDLISLNSSKKVSWDPLIISNQDHSSVSDMKDSASSNIEHQSGYLLSTDSKMPSNDS